MNDHSHLMKQLELGEFDPPHAARARSMTHIEFAKAHNVPVRGTGVYLHCVTVDGVDYFWNADTGAFDGWGGMTAGRP